MLPEALGFGVAIGAGLLIAGIMAFGAALQAVYSAAVYFYAVVGEPPEGFDRDLIRDSFARKPDA